MNVQPKFIQENEEWDKKSLRFFEGNVKWSDLALDVVAFANNKGGNIYFGIEDSAELPEENQIINQEWQDKWIPEIRTRIVGKTENLNPLIITVEKAENGGEYLKIQIIASRNTVACRSDGVYAIRFNDTTHRLKPSELGHLFAEKNNFVWETVKTQFKFENCDQNLLSDLVLKIRSNEKVDNHIKQKTDLEICEYYSLVFENYLTNLGVMWIGTKSMRARIPNMPQLSIVYCDQNQQRSKPQKDFTDLEKSPLQILESVSELETWKEGKEISDGFFRTFVSYYPVEVIKELVANALCHRAYTMGGDIFINIYENLKVEIISPSSLPFGITPENILHKQFARNPHFTELAKATKMMEKLGSGYDKIYEKMFSQGQNPPTVISEDDCVKVILDKQIPDVVAVNLISDISKKYNFNQREITTLGLIAFKNALTTIEIANELKIKTEDVKTWFGNLTKEKIILSKGETKGTVYFVNPLVLKNLNHKKKTSLKTIEKPRLKALILEDLELHPNSSVGEIHERIGKEINIHTIRNMMKFLYENKFITKFGIKRWVKYSLYTQ
jgi:ATP-dependent DNA helicase RecG